jgi:hypothetical protein
MRVGRPESSLRSLTTLLAPANGRPLNTAWVARQLGVSRQTAVSRVRALERKGLVHLLPFYRGSRRPLFYLRDRFGTGLDSFRAFCIESIINCLQQIIPGSEYYWWKTGRVRQVDLLALVGEQQIGFCFSASQVCRNKDWRPLQIGYCRGLIHRGYLLSRGKRAFVIGEAVHALPLGAFLEEAEEWILRRRTVREARAARDRINRKAVEFPARQGQRSLTPRTGGPTLAHP